MSLDGDPRLPVPHPLQEEIMKRLWRQPLRNPTTPTLDSLELDAYFSYYTTECNMAIQAGSGQYSTIRSHSHIVAIAMDLENHCIKMDAKTKLRPMLTRPRSEMELDNMLEGSVTLVARLLTMVDIGPRVYMSDEPSIRWDDQDLTLRDVLAQRFQALPVAVGEDMELDEELTANNLMRLAGLEIEWTDNLSDHLRLSHGSRRVSIFHHASFLKWQCRSVYIPVALHRRR